MILDIFNPKKMLKAVSYALNGLVVVAKKERAFQEEMIMTIILTPIALWLGKNGVERALLIASLFLVMVFELLNSAVEILVDRISPEWHELSGHAKDAGSAAVFLSILMAVIVWVLILVG